MANFVYTKLNFFITFSQISSKYFDYTLEYLQILIYFLREKGRKNHHVSHISSLQGTPEWELDMCSDQKWILPLDGTILQPHEPHRLALTLSLTYMTYSKDSLYNWVEILSFPLSQSWLNLTWGMSCKYLFCLRF